MHELSIASELLDLVLRVAGEHRAGSVTKAQLRIGAASCLSPEALAFGFEALAAGTSAAGCRLEIRRSPAPACCPGCGWSGEILELGTLACPACALAPLTLQGGRDLTVESIDVE